MQERVCKALDTDEVRIMKKITEILIKWLTDFYKKAFGNDTSRFDSMVKAKVPGFIRTVPFYLDEHTYMLIEFEPEHGYGKIEEFLKFEDDRRLVNFEQSDDEGCIAECRKVCKKFKTNVVVPIPSNMRRFCDGKDAIVVFDKNKDFMQ